VSGAAGVRAAGIACAILLLGGAAWMLRSDGQPAGAPSAASQDKAPAAKPTVPPATAAAPKVPETVMPLSNAKTNEHRIQYPGGQSMPALNGVTADVKLNWGTRPFTPIIGVEVGPDGQQWYVHENGTRSTVSMNTMNGVPQAMGMVAEPTEPRPMVDKAKPPADQTPPRR